MTNHFHLLVRSCGGLSEALRRIENEYSKYFNTKYGDEGELCKGRFLSVCVRDDYHLRNPVLYLDENPLSPTPPLATRAEAYEWGSAYRFARARRTLWLSRDAVEAAGVTYGGAPAVPSPLG